jgi:hypothetical protein
MFAWLRGNKRGKRPHVYARLLVEELGDRTLLSAIISNGVIQLGINDEGHLNVDGGTPSSGEGTTAVGLRFVATNAESTAPGCLCEGFGVADAFSGVTGYANVSSDGGPNNLTLVSFTSTASTAVSIVDVVDTIDDDVTTMLRVTHDYHPTPATTFLYEVVVTFENRGTTDITDLRYRRVMDWDVEPTAFDEFVTIRGWTSPGVPLSPALLGTHNDGFDTADPLGESSPIDDDTLNQDVTDFGPDDHGALFDFGLGLLAAGTSNSIRIFYGASGTEAGALAALAAVNATIYSLGQPSPPVAPDGPTLGTPNTFIFGFSSFHVGGSNSPPEAKPDLLSADQNTPKMVAASSLSANDEDADFDTLTVTAVSPTSSQGGGVTLVGGVVTYTPPTNFTGTDTFTYTVDDGFGGTDTGTVSVEVTGPITDISAGVRVFYPKRYKRAGDKYSGFLTIVNKTGAALSGPITVVFTGLPTGVTLFGGVGTVGTTNGKPSITVPGGILAGKSLHVFFVLKNPLKKHLSTYQIGFPVSIFAGTASPP